MLACKNVTIEFNKTPVIRNVSLEFPVKAGHRHHRPLRMRQVHLAARLQPDALPHPGARVSGAVTLHGKDIYGKDVDAVLLRRRIGMVFQKANPFPTLSIFDNVVAGLRLSGLGGKAPAQGGGGKGAGRRRAVGRGQGPAARAAR